MKKDNNHIRGISPHTHLHTLTCMYVCVSNNGNSYLRPWSDDLKLKIKIVNNGHTGIRLMNG